MLYANMDAFQSVLHRLERLELSPALKFVAELDLRQMTVAPCHSYIGMELGLLPGTLEAGPSHLSSL